MFVCSGYLMQGLFDSRFTIFSFSVRILKNDRLELHSSQSKLFALLLRCVFYQVNMEGEGIVGGIAGMFWRFLVADDPTVNSSCPIAFVLLPACLDTPIIIIISFLSFST